MHISDALKDVGNVAKNQRNSNEQTCGTEVNTLTSKLGCKVNRVRAVPGCSESQQTDTDCQQADRCHTLASDEPHAQQSGADTTKCCVMQK